jgi:hypothetical protein
MADKAKDESDPGKTGRDLTEAEAEKLAKQVIFKPPEENNNDSGK